MEDTISFYVITSSLDNRVQQMHSSSYRVRATKRNCFFIWHYLYSFI